MAGCSPSAATPNTYDPAVDMAGGSLDHGQIAANIIASAHNRLRGTPCRVYGADVRIGAADRSNHFPDASIICGRAEPTTGPLGKYTFVNPVVLFEVLSPSTQGYDLDEKFGHYRTIASLRQYVLVHQDRADVIVFVRQDDESWTFRAYSGLDTTVPLPPAGIDLPLADLYDGLTFPPEPSAEGVQAGHQQD